jgi:putative ABC transport system substrate-binding protein
MSPTLSGKRLELLTATIPGVSRVAVVWDTVNATSVLGLQETQVAAEVLGVATHPLEVRDSTDFEAAFEAAREHADAALLVGGPLFARHAEHMADLAVRSRLPTMWQERSYAEAGGLMAYGSNITDQYRRAAYYVDRILKGAQPADLPVEQPMTFDFVVNMKTAQGLGITFPNEIMLQVTDVIQQESGPDAVRAVPS